jgi:hypothetical protein
MRCAVHATYCLLRNVYRCIVVAGGGNRTSESVLEASHEAMEWLG